MLINSLHEAGYMRLCGAMFEFEKGMIVAPRRFEGLFLRDISDI